MTASAANRTRWREVWLVAALAVVPQIPFLTAAISIDAPVFIAVAHQILEHPADPFGFQMIWDPTSPEVAVFNRNPPLLSYYIAPWLGVFGERELWLHLPMLAFPLLAALSFLGIARRATDEGLAPAVLLVVTPAFTVLATTLMLDVPVLACMLFAVYALLRGSGGGARGWQWTAGAAAAAAGLMKYVGFCTVPLLAAGVALLHPRKRAPALRTLGVPLLVWTLWGVYTAQLYGAPHFWISTDLLVEKSFEPDDFWNQILSTPIYYGGALVFPILVWARALVRPTPGATELAVLGVLIGAFAVTSVLPEGEPSRRHPLEVDEAIFAALSLAGAFLTWCLCLRPRRALGSSLDTLLMLWLGGVLTFSMFLNWHVNAGDALLAAPPAILLLFRAPRLRPGRRAFAIWIAVLLPLSLLLAGTEVKQANYYRTVAGRIAAEIGDRPGRRWFVGHWGLQHYLEREGFEAVVPPQYEREYGKSVLEKGDWVATARNVSQLDVSRNMSDYRLRLVWSWGETTWIPLRTTNADAGAGFYSHHAGYVPFAFSRRPLENAQLGQVVAAVGRARCLRLPKAEEGDP